MLRSLAILLSLVLLSGCAWVPGWVPLIGNDGAGENGGTSVLMGREGGSDEGEGPCSRKGRRWRAGSRVCENDVFSQCFPDGQWRVIGSC